MSDDDDTKNGTRVFPLLRFVFMISQLLCGTKRNKVSSVDALQDSGDITRDKNVTKNTLINERLRSAYAKYKEDRMPPQIFLKFLCVFLSLAQYDVKIAVFTHKTKQKRNAAKMKRRHLLP